MMYRVDTPECQARLERANELAHQLAKAGMAISGTMTAPFLVCLVTRAQEVPFIDVNTWPPRVVK
jgi:hypothetical protein